MAKIDVPSYVDMTYVNHAANLMGNFNVVPSELPDHYAIEFLNNRITSVEDVLDNYDTGYLAWRKFNRLEELANVRRFHELRGPMGLTLDDKTVLRLTVAVQRLLREPEKTSIRWEVTRGNWMLLPREQIIGLADTAFDKVEDCFERAWHFTELINGVTLDDGLAAAIALLEQIDITVGWPE